MERLCKHPSFNKGYCKLPPRLMKTASAARARRLCCQPQATRTNATAAAERHRNTFWSPTCCFGKKNVSSAPWQIMTSCHFTRYPWISNFNPGYPCCSQQLFCFTFCCCSLHFFQPLLQDSYCSGIPILPDSGSSKFRTALVTLPSLQTWLHTNNRCFAEYL